MDTQWIKLKKKLGCFVFIFNRGNTQNLRISDYSKTRFLYSIFSILSEFLLFCNTGLHLHSCLLMVGLGQP